MPKQPQSTKKAAPSQVAASCPPCPPCEQTNRFDELLKLGRSLGPMKVAVVHPTSTSVISATMEAAHEGLIAPVLIGPEDKIKAAALQLNADISAFELVDTEHSHASAAVAAQMAAKGEVAALMKGSLHSDEILGAVVSSASGLRTERRISHVFLINVPTYHKPLMVTDGAINIAPELEAKADICQNAVELWRVLYGMNKRPKVAILSAVETVTRRIPSTLEAAALCKMADRQQITDADLDGPLAFDNAINIAAAKEKGIASHVAGDADILLVPNIETGNTLAKQMIFLGNAEAAGIVLGARVPVILTSRADSTRTRLTSCAVALAIASARKEGWIK